MIPIEEVDIGWIVELSQWVKPLHASLRGYPSVSTAFYRSGIITCRHAIHVYDDRVWFAGIMDGGYKELFGSSFEEHEDIVRIHYNQDIRGIDLETAVAENTEVFILGYPRDYEGMYFSQGIAYQGHADVPAGKGFSGSPVISFERKLVGVWSREGGYEPAETLLK